MQEELESTGKPPHHKLLRKEILTAILIRWSLLKRAARRLNTMYENFMSADGVDELLSPCSVPCNNLAVSDSFVVVISILSPFHSPLKTCPSKIELQPQK
jgi:hypothetical protein